MNKNIALIKGDGIGPEIVTEAVKVLQKVGAKFGHVFKFTNVLMGGSAIDETGVPLPEKTVEICQSSDAVLLGAIGGPKWDKGAGNLRPEAGLLGIRAALGLYANIRPVKTFSALESASPLKKAGGIDLIIVRELIGGAYFGKRETLTDEKGVKSAYDTMKYSDFEIRRIAEVAFALAKKRRNKVTSVDKANVLDSSRLWREVVHKLYDGDSGLEQVELSDMLVDNCAMQLIRNPAQFDVIVTENLFGDILSDEASMLTGSLGMLPSASLGEPGTPALFEPIHGSAPDIAGTGKANPIATILSAAMLLELAFGLSEEARAVEQAVEKTLETEFRTADIFSDGCRLASCAEMGAMIAGKI